jgi:hypothetical protein
MDRTWRDDLETARARREANVVCMKWGTLYGPEWVNRLYGMVQRSTSWKVRFVCFTDDPSRLRPEVEVQPIPPLRLDKTLGKRWPKLGLFSRRLGDLEGMTLYLDLDILILSSLDQFFEHEGRFCVIREWKDRHRGYGNTSVVRFFVGRETGVLDRFYSRPHRHWHGLYDSKEQNFVSKSVDEITFWPEEWCVPFAQSCLPRNRVVRFFSVPRKPDEGRILVFFGSITPETALAGCHKTEKRSRPRLFSIENPLKQRFRPAPWIGEYWHE